MLLLTAVVNKTATNFVAGPNSAEQPFFYGKHGDDPHFDKQREAQRGAKLARFPLFDMITLVWWEEKARREDQPTYDEGEWQDLSGMFARKFIEAIERGDSDTFRLAADALDQIKADPTRAHWLMPRHALDYWLLVYYLNRDSATIDELITFCNHKLNWKYDPNVRGANRKAHDKDIRRRCDALGLAIAPSGRGRKRKK